MFLALGRQRAVLEANDGTGTFRVFAASHIRVVGDLVHFKSRSGDHVLSRSAIRTAVEVDSGFSVPNLIGYGRRPDQVFHEPRYFWHAFSTMMAQASRSDIRLSFMLAEFSCPHGVAKMGTTLLDYARIVRWYDFVAMLDDQTIGVLLLGCGQGEAESVQHRLVEATPVVDCKMAWKVSQAPVVRPFLIPERRY